MSLEPVFFVCKRGRGVDVEFGVGEVEKTLPWGFFEVKNPPTRTLQRRIAEGRARKLALRAAKRNLGVSRHQKPRYLREDV